MRMNRKILKLEIDIPSMMRMIQIRFYYRSDNYNFGQRWYPSPPFFTFVDDNEDYQQRTDTCLKKIDFGQKWKPLQN